MIKTLIESGVNFTVAVSIDDLRTFMDEVFQRPTPEKLEKYLSPKQVCLMLDIDNSTLWRWRQNGYLLSIKVGGKIRYKLSEIEKILQTENA